ncbi:alpha-galactosidase [Shewanella inventionis]|uniref:Alpha-galactosidase n=1 Tax=Shewanella inventionis TaxID=1738770 RepID=A0ABQ1JFV0_9GAMM|nr:alpha-galactosidase [Shewanella inventionis]MCL1158101.1 alpha-galactosidase [Shewanella inventionis]GGB65263.1 alpha-galactosidase [Shewanella inventionis]
MSHHPNFVLLNGQHTSVVVDCSNKTPAILYFGKKISSKTTYDMMKQLSTRQEAKCSVVVEAPISLSPLMGEGFTGAPGIEIFDNNIAWSIGGTLTSVTQPSANQVIFESIDSLRNLSVKHHLTLDPHSDVLSATTQLTNLGNNAVNVNWCAAPTIPMPLHIDQIMSFEGRWSNEFQRKSFDMFLGSFVRENRKGKTSHDNFPGMVMHNKLTHEQGGECYGFHLGWSGNHKMRAELLAEGRSYAQLGELLMPGELVLAPNESYTSPTLYSAYSNQGFSGLSHHFHQFVRQSLITDKVRQKPRPVHYNTWEGIYFDHDVAVLQSLATQAADIGAERFVLDDGWFKGRRGDFAGLGDWTVDRDIYPNGLQPLIDHVNSVGMEFGLWFEPEMVNPDSDLYRNHPEWALQTAGNEQLKFRKQLVLDMTNPAVTDYLFNAINDILVEYPQIVYIKWDMNRDLNHAGNFAGKPAVHQQTLAAYTLIERLKQAHPHVEIESCSSGGARVDYGVLRYTDRVWTSDSNDALDRLTIQRGCSFFFPAEVMGAHVGPRDCHITGRNISIAMRAAVAFFGHMGIEMDPRELTDDERQQLQQIIKLHKQHRQLIHSGKLVRLNSDGDSINFGIVNADQSQALFAYNSVKETQRTNPPKYHFAGLDADKDYTLSLVWPAGFSFYSPSVLSVIDKQTYSGEALMTFGMQLPITFPQTSLIFELNQVK